MSAEFYIRHIPNFFSSEFFNTIDFQKPGFTKKRNYKIKRPHIILFSERMFFPTF